MVACAAALVTASLVSHPEALPLRPGLLLAFDPGRLPAVLRSLALLAAFNLAAWAAGGAAGRLVRVAPGGGVVCGIRRLALGLLAIAYTVLLLAALHALWTPLLAALLAGLALAGALGVARDWPRRTRVRWPRPGGWTEWVLAAAAVVTGAVALLGAFMPDYGWDAFTYHLALPERYLFANGIVVSPTFVHSTFPLTVQMLYTLALAVDPGPLTKLLHAELGVLAVTAVGALAARHSARAAVLCVIALLADPLVHWEMGVAYADLGAALFAVLALASLQDVMDGGDAAAPWLCGLFAGACVATRYTAATVPVAVMVVLALRVRPRSRALRGLAVVALVSALMVAPWAARNLVFTGNPVAPALQGLFYEPGQEFFDARAVEQQVAQVRRIGFGRGLDDLLLLPVNLTVRAGGDYTRFGFRLGAFALAGAAVAAALARARRSPALRGVLAAAGILVLGWFFSTQEPRYLLPALALLALAAGVGWDELVGVMERRGRAWAAAAWLVPLAALAHGLWPPLTRMPYVWGYALGRLPVEGFEAQEPALVAARRLRPLLREGDRLLLVYEPRGFFFRGLDYVPSYYFDTMQQIHRAGDPDALAGLLREQGVTHVLVNANNVARYGTVEVPGYGTEELTQDLALLEETLRRHSSPLLAERGVFVRRMGWAPPAP
jgi:hypothetical protein